MVNRIYTLAFLALMILPEIFAQPHQVFPDILNVKEQADYVFQITQKRLDQLIPEIMEETGFDMWIIACNEDDLDPVFETMIPYQMWCPITQILVFYYRGPENGVERLNISRTNLDGLFTNTWDYKAYDKDQGESQWECLERIVVTPDKVKVCPHCETKIAKGKVKSLIRALNK